MGEMSNEAWEVVQRIKMYRKKALEVLKNSNMKDVKKLKNIL